MSVDTNHIQKKSRPIAFYLFFLSFLVSACTLFALDNPPESSTGQMRHTPEVELETGSSPVRYTPTPDPFRVLPTMRVEPEEYTVQRGDTLGKISQQANINLDLIIQENRLENPDLLEIGQVIIIPAPEPGPTSPDYKIIPNSELVNSPSAINFNIDAFVNAHQGFLNSYQEETNGTILSGAEIIQKVSAEFSVHPRVLLGTLEYLSNWVTDSAPSEDAILYPMQYRDPTRQGLLKQLSWGANELNRGYYLWRANAIGSLNFLDGTYIPLHPTLNAGTVAIQYSLSKSQPYDKWLSDVQPGGIDQTFSELFGNPFDFGIEPLIPANLTQPVFQLPFEKSKTWYFTGGPHAAWGSGSAWGALDFAPPDGGMGCIPSDEWVVAIGTGTVARTSDGVLVQNINRDGKEQTGWSVLYLHVDIEQHITAGTFLEAGDIIGYPSCAGGFSTGTHLHIARMYNGEWIPADSEYPFILDGWKTRGTGKEYNGFLFNEDVTLEAYNGKKTENQVYR